MTGPLDLLGPWTLRRRIEDRLAGETLEVTGTTTLTSASADDDRVAWREEGLLHRPAHPPVAVRRELAVVRRDGGWWVVFDHGGDFHPWQPGAWVEHPCGPDHYSGLVEVDQPAAWRVTWRVTGPAKDYTMRSVLTRY